MNQNKSKFKTKAEDTNYQSSSFISLFSISDQQNSDLTCNLQSFLVSAILFQI